MPEDQKASQQTTESIEERDERLSRFRPGTYGAHEAFHMAFVLAEEVDLRLCQHPTVMLNPAWEELAQKACDTLHELYQAIGQEHCNRGDQP
jgi:hypothetical protein